MAKFQAGDIIQNIKPYKGEPEKIVNEVDLKRGEYKCVAIRDGKVLWDSKIAIDNDPFLHLVG